MENLPKCIKKTPTDLEISFKNLSPRELRRHFICTVLPHKPKDLSSYLQHPYQSHTAWNSSPRKRETDGPLANPSSGIGKLWVLKN